MSEQPNYLFKLYSNNVLIFESYDIVDVLWHYLDSPKNETEMHIDRDDINLFDINKDGTLIIM